MTCLDDGVPAVLGLHDGEFVGAVGIRQKCRQLGHSSGPRTEQAGAADNQPAITVVLCADARGLGLVALAKLAAVAVPDVVGGRSVADAKRPAAGLARVAGRRRSGDGVLIGAAYFAGADGPGHRGPAAPADMDDSIAPGCRGWQVQASG
jgi:hypothetical protein